MQATPNNSTTPGPGAAPALGPASKRKMLLKHGFPVQPPGQPAPRSAARAGQGAGCCSWAPPGVSGSLSCLGALPTGMGLLCRDSVSVE